MLRSSSCSSSFPLVVAFQRSCSQGLPLLATRSSPRSLHSAPSVFVPLVSSTGSARSRQLFYSSWSLPRQDRVGVTLLLPSPLSALRGPVFMPARSVFIQTLDTPNPASLKFVPTGKVVMDGEGGGATTFDFPTKESARVSPLAKALFNLPNVRGVFYGPTFVTVTKDEDADWLELKPQVFGAIMDFFATGEALFAEEQAPSSDTVILDTDSEQVAMIKDLLATRIRPAVQNDGGDIVFHGFKDGVVYLKMQGSCSGCPSSAVTLKAGIENMLCYFVPEVERVEHVVEEWEKKGMESAEALEKQLKARRAKEENKKKVQEAGGSSEKVQVLGEDVVSEEEKARIAAEMKKFKDFVKV